MVILGILNAPTCLAICTSESSKTYTDMTIHLVLTYTSIQTRVGSTAINIYKEDLKTSERNRCGMTRWLQFLTFVSWRSQPPLTRFFPQLQIGYYQLWWHPMWSMSCKKRVHTILPGVTPIHENQQVCVCHTQILGTVKLQCNTCSYSSIILEDISPNLKIHIQFAIWVKHSDQSGFLGQLLAQDHFALYFCAGNQISWFLWEHIMS